MEINEFVDKFAEQFYETDSSLFEPNVEFRKFSEWSSMTGLCVLSMIKDEFGFFLDPADFKKCVTIEDVYNAVMLHK